MTKRSFRTLRRLTAVLLCAAVLTVCGVPALADPPATVEEHGNDRIRIGCIGCSVTWGVGGTPYPTQLQQMLGDGYDVKNFGISGATARDDGHDQSVDEGHFFGYRTSNPSPGDWNYNDVYETIYPEPAGKGKYEQSLAFRADIYIIALGSNDTKACNWSRGGADRFYNDLKSIVEEYRNLPNHPTVILGTSPGFARTSQTIKNYIVPAQRQLAQDLGIPFVETYEPTDARPELFISDGSHLNTAGYKILAQRYYEKVKELTGEVTGELAPDVIPVNSSLANLAEKWGEKKVRIGCIGDSVTWGVGGTSYPAQLQQLLGTDNFEVINFGISGATARDDGHDNNINEGHLFGYRTSNPGKSDWNYNDVYELVFPRGRKGTSKYQQSLDYQADIYIISIGGNDAKACNWNNGGEAGYYDSLRSLVEEYINLPHHPLVILGTSPGGAKSSYGINLEAMDKVIVPAQRQLAKDLNLPFAETYADTVGNAAYFIDDGVHLNTAGYGVVAKKYYDVIKTLPGCFANAAPDEIAAGDALVELDEETASVYLTLPFGVSMSSVDMTVKCNYGLTYLKGVDLTTPYTFTLTSPDGTVTREYGVYATTGRKLKVACVGDSVTAGGFPTDLQQILGDGYDVKNFGVNSTTLQEDGKKETDDHRGAYIYHPQYQQSLDYQPDVVFILLGANDGKQGEGQTYGGYDLVTNWKSGSERSFSRSLTALVESYRALDSKPIVVIATSTKAYQGSWGVNVNVVNNTIVPLQRQLAEELGCPLADTFELTRATPSLIGGDGLHPNAQGNAAIARLYADTLAGLNLENGFCPPKATALKMTKVPAKVAYELGSVNLDPAGATVQVSFDDGTTREYPVRLPMTSGFDGSRPDLEEITVKLYGQSTSFLIGVVRPVIPGDVDGDGEVTSTDARLVLQLSVDKIVESDLTVPDAADVDGDGEITSTDARLILQKSVGKVDKFPIE